MLGYGKLYTSVAEKGGRRGMFSKIVPQSIPHHTPHYPSSFCFLPPFLDTEHNKYYLHDRAHQWTDRNDNSRCIATAIVALLRYNYARWYVQTMLLSCGRLSPSDYRRCIGVEVYCCAIIRRKKVKHFATLQKYNLLIIMITTR